MPGARAVLGDGAFDRGHREGAVGLVGLTSISASAGSKPWNRSCDSSA
jgi:hypothetical protein